MVRAWPDKTLESLRETARFSDWTIVFREDGTVESEPRVSELKVHAAVVGSCSRELYCCVELMPPQYR